MDVTITPKDVHNKRDKVYLTSIRGYGFIFDIADYIYVRSKHRIVGTATGVTKEKGFGPDERGMPIQLTMDETRVLIETGVALLVSKNESFTKQFSLEEIEEHRRHIEIQVKKHGQLLKAKRLSDVERNMDKIMEGRKKKLLKQGVPENEIKLSPEDILKEIGDKFKCDVTATPIPTIIAYPLPHTARIINLPKDTSLRYRVFHDLWSRGKFISCGEAFGADFAVYPGDPGMYHASHLIILLSHPTLSPLTLITKVRLGVSVNKTCVFAYFDSKGNTGHIDGAHEPNICYQTMQWDGNSEARKQAVFDTLRIQCDSDSSQ